MQNHARSQVINYQTALDQTSGQQDSGSWLTSISDLPELDVCYEAEEKILWQYMKPAGRPSFTLGLLRDLAAVLDAVEKSHLSSEHSPIQYMILASRLAGIYNLGGDLTRFQEMIKIGDREGLRHYAHSCIHVQHRRASRMNLPICTIALVQGDALGGGFEVALAHDVIIAEKSAKFGLPEILFNLFPGMGAYSFLSRRLDGARAERLMTSGQLYSAQDMYDMGIVDVLAEDGAGTLAVSRYIEQHRRASKSRMAIAKVRDMVSPVTLEEMMNITDLWVETALTLDPRDLRKMQHLVAAQERRVARTDIVEDETHRASA
ncbi:crotonase/enoyl-CoA hydratase family protein [Telmatospirillum siberiense]|uniref:Enoyl-CoA hydratase n=1 Tax=Telmatospirillum siberiense TaxID=382514 RepID=A0A2N3PQ68_9PROT|nr:crotonase/enoyl-CoA hydratase family protein [Telmatospirillum siberiense]PKU22546.1 enoyl-CoA hydratase [Telmatospirillum siberiense]